ncbi:hypothetical protein Mal64_12320 [Pseudobythopirellula maris]|uniref:Uncharacterized protein n=1 Tax=Pseudobythopirellula maris TaxID=2527991 RepID=A0A5C5ZUS1_9BACT|nr:hypothetical protein [Pseudobythopirellula maris]TWT90835.1 hypothetical protein Mal64_12320 [Pseudobythopirellula maris]
MGRKNANKKPKQGGQPAPRKVVRQREDPTSSNHETPVWLFGNFDNDSQWGLSSISPDVASEVLSKLKNYESMTWGAIERDKKRNHSVGVEQFCTAARKRFLELNLDVDELFRFRFDGVSRLWGIRDRHQFKAVWWDPNHEVAPSKKKHT